MNEIDPLLSEKKHLASDCICSKDNLQATSSAFALIACADAELAESEIERFKLLFHEAEACEKFDPVEFEKHFLFLSQAMLQDYGAGRHRALEAISRVRGDTEATGRVIAAAQQAIVADGELKEVEEKILNEICQALGVDPDNC